MRAAIVTAWAHAIRPLVRQKRRLPRRAARLIRRLEPSAAVVSCRRKSLYFELDLRDNLQRELFFLGRYEEDLHELLRGEVGPGDVFVDVGANIGLHALGVAAACPQAKVIAFEPAPDTVERLERAARRNAVSIQVVPAGLAAEGGVQALKSSRRWGVSDVGVRSLYGDGPVVGQVPLLRFDDWIDQSSVERLDVVKIDVEGAEVDALRGMRKSLARFKPRLVVVEVVPTLLERAGASVEELLTLMEEAGFRASRDWTGERASDDPLWPNVAFRPM